MKGIINPLLGLSGYKTLLEYIDSGKFPVSLTGISGAQKSHIIYSLAEFSRKPCVVITHSEAEARRLYKDLSHFLSGQVVEYPAKEVVFYDIDAMSRDIAEKRLNVIEKLLRKDNTVVILTFRALMQKLPQPYVFEQAMFSLNVGDEVSMDGLIRRFISGGYERVDIVDGMGQFAVRGGIVDFFPFSEELACRIEMFGDMVDSIRKFDVSTQRSVEMINQVSVFPVTEAVIDKASIGRIIESIRTELETAGQKNRPQKERNALLRKTVEGDLEKIRETTKLNSVDRYFSHFYGEGVTILDYLAKDTLIFMDEPQKSLQVGEAVYTEFSEMYKNQLEKGTLLPDGCSSVSDVDSLLTALQKGKLISLASLSSGENLEYTRVFNLQGREVGDFHSFEQLTHQIEDWKKSGNITIILAGTASAAQRISRGMRENGIENTYTESFEDKNTRPGQVIVTRGTLSGSFEYPLIKLVVISDRKLLGEEKKPKKPSKRRGIREFTDLNTGDYVVHQVHGIGQYVGIEKLVVERITRDYLKIRYANDDMLYIPTTQLEVIQKYIGSEGKTPKLNKLGGADWSRIKKKVKESLKDIAGELLVIYARRQASRGYSFSKDTVWQKQFEERFPYQETEDQLRCIEEVKQDMESERPMDRLLCGDVGFGKTEVAIRAAFKAAMDGKQTAYLVPTTILAQQHFNTFTQRMRDFPVRIEMLSRFRTLAQQKKILKDVKNGTVDILIGTHRILQKDIQFKDLGLLIVDEEQRFGVSHKERIKALKNNVDVLTLTATPIPRTLHMAMVGIRDMSVIYDPPEDRHPVQTFVMEHDSEVIKEAITREINRKGQVYYLSNRVRSIHRVASDVKKLVPQASIVVGHGQMEERELEEVMMGFIEGKWDAMVCTSIIESGLDIPNVNTIVIEDADRLGLAQLYQLRGRVGRSNRTAYAYVTYKRDKVLAEDAEKRLKAIRDFTEFGSGFKIAMRDLEIRGAGNLVGAEQHGHMEAVGYDTYCRLLEESVKELKGETVNEYPGVQIDLNVSAYISDEYIQNENQKIEMYKKIASVQENNDIQEIEDELIDRYGDIPEEVYNLLEIAYIKTLSRSLGITMISDKTGAVVLQFLQGSINIEVLGKLIESYRGRILFTASNPPYITYKDDKKNSNKIPNIKNLLQCLKKLQ